MAECRERLQLDRDGLLGRLTADDVDEPLTGRRAVESGFDLRRTGDILVVEQEQLVALLNPRARAGGPPRNIGRDHRRVRTARLPQDAVICLARPRLDQRHVEHGQPDQDDGYGNGKADLEERTKLPGCRVHGNFELRTSNCEVQARFSPELRVASIFIA